SPLPRRPRLSAGTPSSRTRCGAIISLRAPRGERRAPRGLTEAGRAPMIEPVGRRPAGVATAEGVERDARGGGRADSAGAAGATRRGRADARAVRGAGAGRGHLAE